MAERSATRRKDWQVAWILLSTLLVCWIIVPRSFSQERLSASRYKSGPSTRRAFRKLIDESRRCVVEVFEKEKPLALGAIMSEDGEILTKASELRGDKLRCELGDGRSFDAKIIAKDRDTDLALLKISGKNLPVLKWDDAPARPEVGQWFITPGLKELPLSVGVVSVADYSVPTGRGVLGISLADEEVGPRITKVFSNTGAAEAGLKVGDIVTRVADQAVKTASSLSRNIGRLRPGDSLKLYILRNKKELEIQATLGHPPEDMTNLPNRRGNFQNRLGGKLSVRRHGFTSIIQHDSVLAPNQCGGPVVGLSGKVLGLNIARGGRTESYALPAKIVLSTYKDLKADALTAKKMEVEK